MTDNVSPFEAAVNWIRAGYPEGIPATDFPPLLALLVRSLDERQVTDVVLRLARDHDLDVPLTEDNIGAAIAQATDEKPTAEKVNQVASRLAAAGWPLAHAQPSPADTTGGEVLA